MADETRKDELTDDELEQSVGGRRAARAETPEGVRAKRGKVRPTEDDPVLTTQALGEEGQDGGGILR